MDHSLHIRYQSLPQENPREAEDVEETRQQLQSLETLRDVFGTFSSGIDLSKHISARTMDLDKLAGLREAHQTEDARDGVRQAHFVSGKDSSSGSSEVEDTAKNLVHQVHRILRQNDERRATQGLKRTGRWIPSENRYVEDTSALQHFSINR